MFDFGDFGGGGYRKKGGKHRFNGKQKFSKNNLF